MARIAGFLQWAAGVIRTIFLLPMGVGIPTAWAGWALGAARAPPLEERGWQQRKGI